MIKDIKTRTVTKGTIKTLKGTIKTIDKSAKTGTVIKDTGRRINARPDPAEANAEVVSSTEEYAAYTAEKAIRRGIRRSSYDALHVKRRREAAKESIKTSNKSIKTVATTVKQGAKQIKETAKTEYAKAKLTTTAYKSTFVGEKSFRASYSIAQKNIQQTARTAKATATTAKKAIQLSVKAIFTALKCSIQALISAEQALAAFIASGGWILLIIVLLVFAICIICSSAVGVFSGIETDNKTLTTVEQQLNEEFTAEIEKQKKKLSDYDEIEVRPAEIITEWNNIVSVYAVRCDKQGLVAAEMTEENIALLRKTMWDMVTITVSEEKTEEYTVDVSDSDNADKSDKNDKNKDADKKTKTKTIGVITATYKSLSEAADFYSFSDSDSELMQLVLSLSTGDNYIGGNGNGKMINPCPNGTLNGDDYPNYSSGGYHGGRDFSCPIGTPVYAAADGTVIKAIHKTTSYGNYIMIAHGNDVYTLYAHNSELLVSVGDTVKQGQLIAYSGDVGNASGPHLHFEVRVGGSQYKVNNVDPSEWIKTD